MKITFSIAIALIFAGCNTTHRGRDYVSEGGENAQPNHSSRAQAGRNKVSTYSSPPKPSPRSFGPRHGNTVLKHNAMSDSWSYQPIDARPRYNANEGRWEMALPSDILRYNTMGDFHQYAPANAVVKYNTIENRYQFANPDDELMHNTKEGLWQYAPRGSQLRYNTREDRWEFVRPLLSD